MNITKQKIISVCFILVVICIILAIGYVITGKIPEGFTPKVQTLPIPTSGIPEGYYQVDVTNMAALPTGNSVTPIPYGGPSAIKEGYYKVFEKDSGKYYMAQIPPSMIHSPTDLSGLPTNADQVSPYLWNSRTASASAPHIDASNEPQNTAYHYDTNNYNVQYHATAEELNTQGGIYNTKIGSMVVKDKNGSPLILPYVPGQAMSTYYYPGSFTYGSANYVPNYEDSVYLSRTTAFNTDNNPDMNMAKFCDIMKNNPLIVEKKCNSLSNEQCTKNTCCVLFGGSRCVAGDANGPTNPTYYMDPSVNDKEVYYYYGNIYRSKYNAPLNTNVKDDGYTPVISNISSKPALYDSPLSNEQISGSMVDVKYS